jgi:hypothetical protein
MWGWHIIFSREIGDAMYAKVHAAMTRRRHGDSGVKSEGERAGKELGKVI